MSFNKTKCLIAPLIGLYLSACAVTPKDLDSMGSDADDSFKRLVNTSTQDRPYINRQTHIEEAINTENLNMNRLSRGDIVRLRIQSMDAYDGLYQINSNGRLELPINESVPAAGLTRKELNASLQNLFFAKGWFVDLDTLIDVSLVRAAAIDVSVHGSVFNPGRITINGKPASKQEDAIQQTNGEHANNRDLIAAITAAGGIRPDADLSKVVIIRNNMRYSLNLSRIISGTNFVATPSLVHGDQIYISSIGKEDVALIRPTQITPPGMRVLISNLTAPSLSNAQAAVGQDATRLAYGSSLLDGAISANCVGGTHQANASRSILLITRHYGSNKQLVIKRSINQLLAASSQTSVNPFLMPNDGIACYDSRFTNIRDLARGIGEIFGPVILRGIL